MFDVLLVKDKQYLPTLLTLLDQARKSVDMLAYSFAIGSAAGRINVHSAPYAVAEKLARLRQTHRRLKIRLYLEGQRDTAERNTVTAEFLRKRGVTIRFGATHAKGVCVDGRFLLIGSTNLTQQSMLLNPETNLFIQGTGPSTQFTKYFNHRWAGRLHGEVKLGAPLLADGAFKHALIELIDRSRKRIEFSIYFFQQAEIEEALIRAHKRGVKVSGLVHDHRSFALSYVRRTHGTVKRLLKAGIGDLHAGQAHLFTHSKYLIADRQELLLGTGNWLDEDVEVHPQLYVRLRDAQLASTLARHLNGQLKRRKKFS